MNNKNVRYDRNVPQWIIETMSEDFCMGWSPVLKDEDFYVKYVSHNEAECEIVLCINGREYAFDQLSTCYMGR